jgi:hypothetical protein
MRASDADRERFADTLRDAAAEGRLEPDELEERLEAVYTARTLGDLDSLTADLPRQPRRAPRNPRPPSFSPLLLAAVITLAIVVHPLIWLALIPLFSTKHGWGCAGRHRGPVRI